MSERKIIKLLREVQRLQRIPEEQREGEDDEAFDARVAAFQAEDDDWIGSLCHKGNSVCWTHSKAKRYGDDLMKAWSAMGTIGCHADGKTHLADAIRRIKTTEPVS